MTYRALRYNDSAVTTLIAHSAELSVLFLSDCTALRQLLINSTSLTVLSCRGCAELRVLSLDCPSLAELDLTDTALDDVALANTLRSVSSLRVLSLRNCSSINTPSLTAALPSLTSMDCCYSSLSTDGLTTFLEQTPALSLLQLTDCAQIDDIRLSHQHSFQEVTARATFITDESISNFILQTSGLLRLNLHNCLYVTGKTIRSATLTVLELSMCPVTDESLSSLFLPQAQCPSLRSINLSHCYKLHSPSITSSSLEIIYMKMCREMTALTLECTSLVELDISNSISLSSMNIRDCSELTVIHAKQTTDYLLHALADYILANHLSVRVLDGNTHAGIHKRAAAAAADTDVGYKRTFHPHSGRSRRSTDDSPLNAPSPSQSQSSPSSAMSEAVNASPAAADHVARSQPRPINRSPQQHRFSGRSPNQRLSQSPQSATAIPTTPSPKRNSRPQTSPPTTTNDSPTTRRHIPYNQPSGHASAMNEINDDPGEFASFINPPSIPRHIFTVQLPQQPILNTRSVTANIPADERQQVVTAFARRTEHPPSITSASFSPASSSALVSLHTPVSPASFEPASPMLPAEYPLIDTRSATMSTLDSMPRCVLNTIEVYVLRENIRDLEHKLTEHERLIQQQRTLQADIKRGGVAAQAALQSSLILSSQAHSQLIAIVYGLKKKLALLKARLKT